MWHFLWILYVQFWRAPTSRMKGPTSEYVGQTTLDVWRLHSHKALCSVLLVRAVGT